MIFTTGVFGVFIGINERATQDFIGDSLNFLGESLEKLLHGEENFNYYEPIYAGDEITVCKKITDIIDKKEGALQFVISQTDFTNQHEKKVAETITNYVFRH